MNIFFLIGSFFGIFSSITLFFIWNYFRLKLKHQIEMIEEREKRLKLDFSRRIKDLTAHIDLIYTKKEDEIKQINS